MADGSSGLHDTHVQQHLIHPSLGVDVRDSDKSHKMAAARRGAAADGEDGRPPPFTTAEVNCVVVNDFLHHLWPFHTRTAIGDLIYSWRYFTHRNSDVNPSSVKTLYPGIFTDSRWRLNLHVITIKIKTYSKRIFPIAYSDCCSTPSDRHQQIFQGRKYFSLACRPTSSGKSAKGYKIILQ